MENAADLTQSLGKLVHDYNTRERQQKIRKIMTWKDMKRLRGLNIPC